MAMQLESTPIASTFVPGDWWTPERARRAVEAMNRSLATPEVQAILDRAGDDFNETHNGQLQQPSRSPGLTRTGLSFRRGRAEDVPALTELIVGADLPALFIEEFVEGFVAVEKDGQLVATGGLEIYDETGFVRSVAVASAGRGLGLGREIADLLAADARAYGVRDLYLFTQDAYLFWKHVGYVDVPLEAWPQASQACWQYRYVAGHRALTEAMGVHSMWKPA